MLAARRERGPHQACHRHPDSSHPGQYVVQVQRAGSWPGLYGVLLSYSLSLVMRQSCFVRLLIGRLLVGRLLIGRLLIDRCLIAQSFVFNRGPTAPC